MNINELTNLLLKYNINTQEWSHLKGTKTIKNLKEEIDSGEATIEIINNQLFRVVKLVSVEVKIKLGEQLFILVEDKQIFFTGAVRKRGLRNLAEKIRADETPELATYRCLKEEIGLDFKKSLILLEKTEEIKISPSYPNLNSVYQVFNYQVILDENELEFIKFSEYQKHKKKISLFTLELC